MPAELFTDNVEGRDRYYQLRLHADEEAEILAEAERRGIRRASLIRLALKELISAGKKGA